MKVAVYKEPDLVRHDFDKLFLLYTNSCDVNQKCNNIGPRMENSCAAFSSV